MSRIVIVATLTLALLSLLPGDAWAVEAGQRCALKKPLKVAAKAKGKGKKTRVKKGNEVEVVTVEGRWATVRIGEVEGSTAAKKLARICELIEAPPAEETVVVSEAPEEPASTEPPAADANADAAEAAEGEAPADESDAAADAAPDPGSSDAAVAVADADTPPDPDATAAEAAAELDAVEASPPTPEMSDAPAEEEGKIKLAVMDLRGSDTIAKELLASLTALIPQELEAAGPFDAISSQDVRQMLSFEAQKQMVGCDEASCLAEIGGALGVDFIVSGSVTSVGESHYLLQLQLMNIAEARVDGREAREHKGDIAGLLDAVRAASRIVVRDLLAKHSGTLLVRVNEEAAVIKVDDSIVGNSPMGAIEIGGGAHVVTVEKEGFIRATHDINVAAGKEVVLDVSLRPSADFLRQYQASAGRTRMLAWTGIAVGVAALGGAVGALVLGQGTASDLQTKVDAYNASSSRSSAELNAIEDLDAKLGTYDLLTVALTGVGLVSAGVGAALLLTGDDPDRYSAETALRGPGTTLHLAPLPGGVALVGRF